MKHRQFTRTQLISFGLAGGLAGLAATLIGTRTVMRRRDDIEPASTPIDLSWSSWRRALVETKNAFGNKNLAMLATGIAYGGTLAFFPLVVACVAIASIVISPHQIESIVSALSSYLPSDIAGLLTAQLTSALNKDSTNFLIAAAAILIALFGVSGAMNSLVSALNIAYDRDETRNMIRVRLVSIALTCMMVLGIIIVLPLIALGGDLLRGIGTPEWLIVTFSIVRWLLLAVVMCVGLAIVYRYAPDRPNAHWQWVSWGAIMATILWILATAAFFVYVQHFANFSQSYSLFAGIIVLMMWLNYTGLIVLIGGEVNHQLERRTVRSTTVN